MTSHLTVSLELIAFMRWLLKNRKSLLNALVTQSLNDSLYEEMEELAEQSPDLSSDELHSIVNGFLGYIEEELAKNMLGDDEKPARLQPGRLLQSLSSLAQTQLQSFNEDELHTSMQQTAAVLQQKSGEHSEQVKKHLLLRNLLNNWSPEKNKDDVN
ncbi:MAG: hypothetical protein PVJ92_03465 [Candidatus Dependentiae bacterium]|jgi:hypothetical protein